MKNWLSNFPKLSVTDSFLYSQDYLWFPDSVWEASKWRSRKVTAEAGGWQAADCIGA